MKSRNPNDEAAAEPTGVLRTLVDNLDEAVVVLGREGRPQFVNAAAERLYGIDPKGPPIAEWSEAYGIYLPDLQTLWPAEDLPGAAALRGQTVDGEQFIRPAGAVAGYWIGIRARPLFDENGQRICGKENQEAADLALAQRRASGGCWRSWRTRRIW